MGKKSLGLIGVILIGLLAAGCGESKTIYVDTERGLIKYYFAHCHLGMLTNNDGDNILDENSKPITCTGVVELTDAEAKSRGYSG